VKPAAFESWKEAEGYRKHENVHSGVSGMSGMSGMSGVSGVSGGSGGSGVSPA
jgi:hypothetical protein